MENPWSPSAAQRCFRSQNTKRTERSSAGQKYGDPLATWVRGSAVSCLYIDLCLCLAQVFFLQRAAQPKGGASDSAEHNRLMERIARAFCLALCPHLKLLKEDGMAKLGLRVAFESQEVSAAAWCDVRKDTHDRDVSFQKPFSFVKYKEICDGNLRKCIAACMYLYLVCDKVQIVGHTLRSN